MEEAEEDEASKDRKTFEQDEDSPHDALKGFLEQRRGTALKAWILHFDTNNDQRISLSEFYGGMKAMGYSGDMKALFRKLDGDGSGELSLEEIDNAGDRQWRRFRMFCVRFGSVGEAMRRLGGKVPEVPKSKWPSLKNLKNRDSYAEDSKVLKIAKADFEQSIINEGWDGEQSTGFLFDSLDTSDRGYLIEENLSWLNIEISRQRKKDQAKARALTVFKKKIDTVAEAAMLADFKQFLRKKYGGFLRAWRQVLAVNDSMVLQKPQFLKAFAKLGFKGDAKNLWRTFDRDDSGSVSIDELDPQGAELLAHFKRFIDEKWGGAVGAFKALDKDGSKSVKQQEFVDAMKGYGFRYPTKQLFHGLDRDGAKSIQADEILFIDKWKPLPYLIVGPSPEAAKEVKAAFLKKYKNFLKAWRHALDKDNSNHCNWFEFQAACQKCKYQGNVPGAWRFLDADLSGYITLKELDEASCAILKEFKDWAVEEFGSVRSAFGVFDGDGSNEISYNEFRACCRIYGYDGCSKSIFGALDLESNLALSVEEVAFLDDWDFDVEDSKEPQEPTKTTKSPRPKPPLVNEAAAAAAIALAKRQPLVSAPTPMPPQPSAAAKVLATSRAAAEGNLAAAAALCAVAPSLRLLERPGIIMRRLDAKWQLKRVKAGSRPEKGISQSDTLPQIRQQGNNQGVATTAPLGRGQEADGRAAPNAKGRGFILPDLSMRDSDCGVISEQAPEPLAPELELDQRERVAQVQLAEEELLSEEEAWRRRPEAMPTLDELLCSPRAPLCADHLRRPGRRARRRASPSSRSLPPMERSPAAEHGELPPLTAR
mmetsp:Transcript_133735/g.285971  ORF Transcript_133735/g.285971 Transcript_133735/m.285971 type:complete len:821 (-) Transcript_133735:25-2487(-)